MNLDRNGLPVQSDGDALDQLNRVGILALNDVSWRKKLAWLEMDQSRGVYTRYVNSNPNNVSGDQLVPVFAAAMFTDTPDMLFLVKQLAKRLGFAQNTHDTDGSRKLVPDFMLHRVLPFIARAYPPVCIEGRNVDLKGYNGIPPMASKTGNTMPFIASIRQLITRVFGSLAVYLADITAWLGHTIVCLADTALLINTLVTIIDLRVTNDPDHVDPFVNAVATLYACNVYRPTFLSKLSARMLETGALKNTGYIDRHPEWFDGPVAGGLLHYHRAASGGNPEVGDVQIEQWKATLKIARN